LEGDLVKCWRAFLGASRLAFGFMHMPSKKWICGQFKEKTMWCSAVGCLVTLILSLLVAPLTVTAQRPAKIPRIGMLLGGSPDWTAPSLEAFRQRLRELGYVEDHNIAIEYPFAEGKTEPLPALAAELVQLPVDILVTWGTPAARAAKHATRTIPVVIGAALDPVAQGLVASLARPGANITGVSSAPLELHGKLMQVFTEAVHGLSRVAILWNSANSAHTLMVSEAQGAAQVLGLQTQLLDVSDASAFDRAFAAMARERAEALVVLNEQLFLTHRTHLAELAVAHRLPTIYGQREYVDIGGLMSYGMNFRENFRHAATYVDKLLKGAQAAELPMEQPMRFELVINLKTAQALGLTIPPTFLFQVDEVIK
jgi:putative tryptophan/tyrosine transport system substrate-binding protein